MLLVNTFYVSMSQCFPNSKCLYVSMFPQFKIYETLSSYGNKNPLTQNSYYHTVDPFGAIFMRRFYDSKFLQSEYCQISRPKLYSPYHGEDFCIRHLSPVPYQLLSEKKLRFPITDTKRLGLHRKLDVYQDQVCTENWIFIIKPNFSKLTSNKLT